MHTKLTIAALSAALLVTPAFAQSDASAQQRAQSGKTQTSDTSYNKTKTDKAKTGHAGHDMNHGEKSHGNMSHESMSNGSMMQGHGRMNAAQVEKMTESWPQPSRDAIKATTDKYGPPAAMTPDMVIWGEAGPWKRTIVYRNAVQHDFPMPHKDVLQQWTNYKAPPEKYDELAMFDGSVVMARTAGEISARCDAEGANILAVNLAHEVATGKRTVEAARKMYGEQIKAMKAGKPAPYTDKIMFQASDSTGSTDKALAGM